MGRQSSRLHYALIAMVPLAKTPGRTVAVLETSRKAIMEDVAWKDGNYDAPPEKGVRRGRAACPTPSRAYPAASLR
jgi:homoserine acetyltransferase